MIVARPVRLRSWWCLGLAASVLALAGCPRKPDEPDPVPQSPKDAAAPPATSSPPPAPSPLASAPTPASGDAGVDLPFTPKERQEFHQKLNNELCELAAKHQNVVNGRPEFDKKGTLLITGCLFEGNLAWYKCVVATTTAPDFEWCNARYLRPKDEIK